MGEPVVYHDSKNKAHDALITAVWGQPGYLNPCSVNIVIVSDNDTEKDQYGRQVKRETSVGHKLNQTAHGRYWRFVSEDAHDTSDPIT